MQELGLSKNGQYKLAKAAENVKVHAMIWIEILREQNQVGNITSAIMVSAHTVTCSCL